jgi:hypothetical protein
MRVEMTILHPIFGDYLTELIGGDRDGQTLRNNNRAFVLAQ